MGEFSVNLQLTSPLFRIEQLAQIDLGHRAVGTLASVGEFAAFENEAVLRHCFRADDFASASVVFMHTVSSQSGILQLLLYTSFQASALFRQMSGVDQLKLFSSGGKILQIVCYPAVICLRVVHRIQNCDGGYLVLQSILVQLRRSWAVSGGVRDDTHAGYIINGLAFELGCFLHNLIEHAPVESLLVRLSAGGAF